MSDQVEFKVDDWVYIVGREKSFQITKVVGNQAWFDCDDGPLWFSRLQPRDSKQYQRSMEGKMNNRIKKSVRHDWRESVKENWTEVTNSYTFKVNDMGVIDRDLLGKECTIERPLAVCRTDHQTFCFDVHQSIWKKALYCKQGGPMFNKLATLNNADELPIKQLGEVVALVKKIRNASWKRSQSIITCTVDLIEV